VTASSAKPRGAEESQEEVARSLERELGLLAEERQERALRLGIDLGAETKAPN
jgi:hypothetical protein